MSALHSKEMIIGLGNFVTFLHRVHTRKSRNEFNVFTGGLFAGLFCLCRPQFPIGALFMEVLSLIAVDCLANIGTWFTN